MKLNRKWMLVIALVMSLTVATAGTLAYLTDRDTVENTFTMGNVDIEVEETYEQDSELLPGVEVTKEAGIKNVHKTSDAWVWMTVSVPNALKDHITLEWLDGYEGTEIDTVVHPGYTSYVVKYNEKLAPGASTPNFLQSVKLSEKVDYQDGSYVVVEGGVAGEPIDVTDTKIIVDGFAIQTEGFDTVDAAYDAYTEQWAGLSNGGESGANGGEEEEPTNGDDDSVTYEIPADAYKVTNSEELTAAVAAGYTVIELADGEYEVSGCGGKELSLYGSKNAVLKVMNRGEDGCDYGFGSAGTGVGHVDFYGITIDTTANTGNYKGYAYMGATFNDCTFVGAYSLNNANTFEFNYCDFDFKNGYFWTWGANSATFNNCTFNGNSKCILAHGSASTQITINNCKFDATEKGYTGAGDNTACVEIDPVGTNTYTITFTGNNTKTDSYSGWTRVKDSSTGHVISGVE